MSKPLLFVGILFMIFGLLFFLTGLQGEMIRPYAFRRGEEYNIRQELNEREPRNPCPLEGAMQSIRTKQ